MPLKHEYDDHNAHHEVGHAYGASQYGQTPPSQYKSTRLGHNAGYVPGVGPAYGQGYAQHNQQRGSADYNNVGGFGAHGADLEQSYGDDSEVHHDDNYAVDPYEDCHSQPSSYCPA